MSEEVGFFRKLWIGWLVIAGRFGGIQTLVILGFFYAFIIGPMAIGTMIGRRDFLTKRNLGAPESAWTPADTVAPELERAKREF